LPPNPWPSTSAALPLEGGLKPAAQNRWAVFTQHSNLTQSLGGWYILCAKVN
jgi:hypothetical protein